ncbi:MAG: hypothetical protein A2161_03830 [Candidatus Schekmanbacteria bacterium RBG_13_48_7]|uniref:Serpin domain-containing protein n=1 Tax=Candidatus Schekmanbacteria bacterium RBG_13_48_7 TaxID=1817878 RepID=A0A1F7S8I0_9BACT|nr:MAG: hypothetical protein A2161_03830 [Candidatus Schekmanbacteria bacterium RBG_13_48_7]
MKKWFIFVMCSFILLASIGNSPSKLPFGEPPADLKNVVDSNSAFALKLYSKLKAGNGNLFLSPYSISSALATVYAGARGNCERQISTALNFPDDQDKFHSAMLKIHQKLVEIDTRKGIELNVANGLWLQKGYEFNNSFLDLVNKNYDCFAAQVDFKTTYESEREKINSWIERQTKQKIRNALPAGILSSVTRLVILNAIYFKGDWANCFDKKNTVQESFLSSSGNSVIVPLMHQENVFRYGEQDNLQILELPYIGYDLSMLILLPVEQKDLTELEEKLNYDNLARWIKSLGDRTVEIHFPRFAIDYQISLKQSLSTLGMSDAFSATDADFTGMTLKQPLFMDAVEHSALIEVDEQGTVAAASSSVSFGCTAIIPPPLAKFRADHPFFFLIRDNHTGTILFLGRVVDPTN